MGKDLTKKQKTLLAEFEKALSTHITNIMEIAVHGSGEGDLQSMIDDFEQKVFFRINNQLALPTTQIIKEKVSDLLCCVAKSVNATHAQREKGFEGRVAYHGIKTYLDNLLDVLDQELQNTY